MVSSKRKSAPKKRAKPKAKRVRCPYRKGERIVHRTLGELDVAATKKVGLNRWQLAVVSDEGKALIIPVDANIRRAA